MGDQLAGAAGLGAHLAVPHLEIGFKVGGALGVHALLVGLLAERLALDARGAALGAHAGLALKRAHLDAGGHRVGHVAVGPAHAADKAAAGLGAGLHHQVLAALGALAHLGIGRHGIRDRLAQVVLVLDQRIEHAGKQGAGVVDHVILGVLALGHVRHVLVELGRHLRRGDARRELAQRVDDGHAQLARLDGVVLQVAHGVEALDDARTRGLGAQAALLHLLDELTLAVARGRFGLLGLERDVVHVDDVALLECGQLLVALETVRIGLAEARIHQHVAARGERLAGDVDSELGVLDGRGTHERGQETTRDQVVKLLLTAVEGLRIALAGGMDRRVVGGLGLATGGLHGAGQHLLAHGRERRRVGGQALHDALEVERARVDRVVDTRVRDEAAHIKRLGDAHGARGRDALGRGCGLQGGGVERHRRGLLARALGDLGDGARRRAFYVRERGLGLPLVGKARRFVGDLELSLVRGTHAADLPVVLGHKGHALALALDHQGERRRLHTAGGAHVAKAAELGERQVACEHRAPDEVDVLTALAGVGQVLVELHQVLERVGDLALDERGIAGTGGGHVGRDLAHHGERVGTDQLALAVKVCGDDDRVGLFGQVLEDADDLFLRGVLDDGRPGEIRQALDLPALDVDAVGKIRAALGLVRRARQSIGHVGRQDLAVLRYRVPAVLLVKENLVRKVGSQDMARQTHGDPLLAIDRKAVDGGVVDLVVFGFARIA